MCKSISGSLRKKCDEQKEVRNVVYEKSAGICFRVLWKHIPLMVYLIENKSRFVFTPDKYCDNRQGGARLQQELSGESTLRIKTLTE